WSSDVCSSDLSAFADHSERTSGPSDSHSTFTDHSERTSGPSDSHSAFADHSERSSSPSDSQIPSTSLNSNSTLHLSQTKKKHPLPGTSSVYLKSLILLHE